VGQGLGTRLREGDDRHALAARGAANRCARRTHCRLLEVASRPNFVIAGGTNNITNKSPPTCQGCLLNGCDASTYDLPGPPSYFEASIKS